MVNVNQGSHQSNAPVVVASDTIFQITPANEHLILNGPFSINSNTSVTKSGAGTLIINGTQSHGAGAKLVAGDGTVDLNSDGGPNLLLDAIGSAAKVNLNHTQHLNAISLNKGASAATASGRDKVLVT